MRCRETLVVNEFIFHNMFIKWFKRLCRFQRLWFWTTGTSSSGTHSPARATSSSPAAGSRKRSTSSSGRRWFCPVRRTPRSGTAWRARPSTLYRLWSVTTWAAGRFWRRAAALRFTDRPTGRCPSVSWRPPSAPPSTPTPTREGWRVEWREGRGSDPTGNASLPLKSE